MTEEKINEWKNKINKISHAEMASLWRFHPAGHPVFDSTLSLFDYFQTRFKKFGGMTPEISKQIGWEN